MYGQFFHQLIKDVGATLGRGLTKADQKVIDTTVVCLEKRARRRATEALVKGMKATKRYSFDAEFRTAVDTVINIVVPAAFGSVPSDPEKLEKSMNVLIQSVKQDSLFVQGSKAHKTWMDEIMAPQPHFVIDGDNIWQTVTMGQQKSKPVTYDDIVEAKKKLQAGANLHSPPSSGLSGAKTGRFSVKGDPAPAKKDTVAQLLKIVEAKARQLQEEKTAEDMGLKYEEAKKKYPGVFGAKGVSKAVEQGIPLVKTGDTWEFTTNIDMSED